MKSFMGITKIAAFRFMLLLHLFLKVKMCVGFVDAAAVAAGDSDINYDDSDEWVEEKERMRPSWSSSPPPTVPAPASLMRWDGPDPPRGHSGHPPRMHHVRHEQHYLKHGSVQLPGRLGTGSGGMVAPEADPYHAHTVTTTTVTGPQHNPQRHAPDQGHHHKQQQQQQQHHHQNHQHHQHHHHNQRQKSQGRSPVEFSVPQAGGKRDWHEPAGSREAPNGLSIWRGSRSPQEAINRKSSTDTFRDTPVSNALSDNGASADSVGKSSQRAMNPHSKKYFEDLLTDYKRRSPYYKELRHSRGPQTKALPVGKGKSRGSSDATKKANAKVTESDYDYLYDDEIDEDVQNDAAYGGEASTSTKAPATSTTTTTSSTTARTTTTTRSFAKSFSGEDDEAADGDRGYAAYLKNAYAMQSNPARRGNNRFSSLPRADLTSNNQHSRRDMANQVRQSEDYPPLTQYKLAHLGTPEAVSKSYRAYRPKSVSTINSSEVFSHISRIKTEGSCKFPKPMVVPASSDRTKLYFPSCTILHRCDQHAGCCMAPETCAPKSTATVELYFFVSNFGSNRKETIALSFVNHTECHCVQLGHRVQETDDRRSVAPYDWESNGSSEGTGGDIPTCNCPELFRPIFDHGSKCYCDCVSGARDCIRFKEGLEHFSMQTRAKISSNQFKAPSCEYGTYLRQEGRCPTKSERMSTHFSRHR